MKNLSAIFGKDNLDEIVFSNRNKAYGAYALRNEYSNQLTKALLVGVAFFGALSVTPLIISAFETKATIVVDNNSEREIIYIDEPDDTPKPTPTAFVPPNIKTVNITVPTPTRKLIKEQPLPTTEEIRGAAIGSETKTGEETTISVAPPISISGPPAVKPYSPPAKVEDPNEVFTTATVDVSANFKGGMDAFRQKVSQGFDTGSIDQAGMVSGVITFVVEKDGSISNIKINGQNSDFNKEAERTVKSIKTKWTPAQLNGKAVRSSFRMPISMRIE